MCFIIDYSCTTCTSIDVILINNVHQHPFQIPFLLIFVLAPIRGRGPTRQERASCLACRTLMSLSLLSSPPLLSSVHCRHSTK